MRDGKWMPAQVDLALPDDIRVDQLAEWCYLAEAQVGKRLADFPTGSFLLHIMELDDLEAEFKAVPRDNRAGGVGYHWYFAAGHYLKRHPGLSPDETHEKAAEWAEKLQSAISDPIAAKPASEHGGWGDLREYIQRVLTIGGGESTSGLRASVQTELHRYTNAKRKGSGTTQVCALCSSPYRIDKQREAAVLFAPQVYSNKLPLHGSDAIRDICSICSMEMMIRQILMNRTASSGGDFEDRRVRYLFFYPTYFFTPETLQVVRRMTVQLKRVSFTDMRSQLVNKEDGSVNFSPKM